MLFAYRVLRRLPHRAFRLLMHLRAGRFTVGVVTVLTRGDEILLVEQRYRSGWSIPGGSINRNEQPHDGARRELHEEVGLRVPIEFVTPVVENSEARNVMFVYTAELTADQAADIEPGIEIARAVWANPIAEWADLHTEVKRVLYALGRAPAETPAP